VSLVEIAVDLSFLWRQGQSCRRCFAFASYILTLLMVFVMLKYSPNSL